MKVIQNMCLQQFMGGNDEHMYHQVFRIHASHTKYLPKLFYGGNDGDIYHQVLRIHAGRGWGGQIIVNFGRLLVDAAVQDALHALIIG